MGGRMCFLIALVAGVASPAAYASCNVSMADHHPHLIELYTSLGCSSCPPAEGWINTLGDQPGVVALAFHIDYWDANDWRDPFDSPVYTKRQISLSRRRNDGQYYTPQIWLDGRLWRNWPVGKPPPLYVGTSPSMRLGITRDSALHARIEVPNAVDPAALRMYVALTVDGLSVAVKGGENRGKTFVQDQVVRAFAGPLRLPQATADLAIPNKIDLTKSSVVAFVQNERTGDVVQVARLPLKQCGFADVPAAQ